MAWAEDAIEELLYQIDWLSAQLQFATAHERLSQALKQSSDPRLWARLAEVYNSIGNVPEALHCLDIALSSELLQTHPFTATAWRARRLLLRWSQAESPAALNADFQALAQGLPELPRQRRGAGSVSRPWRVGYVSPDFRVCSVARVLAPLLEAHAQAEDFEIFAYDLSGTEDLMARHYQQQIPHWRRLVGLSPEAMRSQICADKLDLCIDLAGITSSSALGLLSERLAPLQWTGLTFNGPVGLSQIDARFSDFESTPVAHWSRAYEAVIPLPSWIWSQMPFQAQAHQGGDKNLRLGCAHHPGRLSPVCLQSWAQIMSACPEVELHLKHRFYGSAWCREHTLKRLDLAGIPPEKVSLHLEDNYLSYLNFYSYIDLALDPFPYHGGLVSLDALWVGCPLVSLSEWMKGGESLLKQVNWTQGIAYNPQEYVQIATQLLSDATVRQEARNTILSGRSQAACFQSERVLKSYIACLRLELNQS